MYVQAVLAIIVPHVHNLVVSWQLRRIIPTLESESSFESSAILSNFYRGRGLVASVHLSVRLFVWALLRNLSVCL